MGHPLKDALDAFVHEEASGTSDGKGREKVGRERTEDELASVSNPTRVFHRGVVTFRQRVGYGFDPAAVGKCFELALKRTLSRGEKTADGRPSLLGEVKCVLNVGG